MRQMHTGQIWNHTAHKGIIIYEPLLMTFYPKKQDVLPWKSQQEHLKAPTQQPRRCFDCRDAFGPLRVSWITSAEL